MRMGMGLGLSKRQRGEASGPQLSLDLDSTTPGRGTSWTFTRGDSATQLATDNVAIVDPGELGLDNITIVVSGVQDGANEVLALGADTFPLNANKSTTELVGGVTFAIGYVTATQTFTLTNNAGGKFSVAAAIAAIEAITQVFSGTPTYGVRTFTFTIEADSVTSAVAVATVSVVDQAPVIDAIADTTATVGVEKTVTPTYTGGVPTSWSATGLSDGAAINPSTGVVTWTPTVETTLNITITATNSGGSDDEAVAITSSISVGNTPPVISIASSLAWVQGDGPTVLDGAATVSDDDSDPLASGSIVAAGIRNGDNEVLVIGGTSFPLGTDKTATGTGGSTTFSIAYTAGFQGGTFEITNNAGGTFSAADYQTLIRAHTYDNETTTPLEGERTFTHSVNDGTDDSAEDTITVSVSLDWLVDESFASDAGGFDVGTQTSGEGVNRVAGILSVPGNVTSTKTFTSVSQSSGQVVTVEAWVKFTDTDLTVGSGSTRQTSFYVMPTSGTVSSANAAVFFGFTRSTTTGANANRVAITVRDGASFLFPGKLSKGTWFKVKVQIVTADRTYRLFINDMLWYIGTSGSASYTDVSRFVVFQSADAPTIFIDNLRIHVDDELVSSSQMSYEQTIISHDFTGGSGDIRNHTADIDTRSIYPQPWHVGNDSAIGTFTLSASGATPDATKLTTAFLRGTQEGVAEAEFVADSSNDIYGGIVFRSWDGSGTGIGAENQLYQARYWSGSGTPMAVLGPTGASTVGVLTGGALQGGLTISAGDTYRLRVVFRGRYVWLWANNITTASGWILQVTHLIAADASGAVGSDDEEHVGVFIGTNLSGVENGNIVKSFSFTAAIPEQRGIVDLQEYEATYDKAFIGEMYLSNSGGPTRNNYWSKGIQLVHFSENEPAEAMAIEWLHELDAANCQQFWTRGICFTADESCGWGECFVTFLRRGVWCLDSVWVDKITGRNFTPDHDYRPDIFEAGGYRIATGSSAGSLLAHTTHHDWRTDATAAMPHAHQVLGDYGSGNGSRITAVVDSVLNAGTATAKIQHKNNGNGSPISMPLGGIDESSLTTATQYIVWRGYYYETGASIALSDTVMTDIRDDWANPATLSFTSGSAKTDAAGDSDTDGFNERYGWYEVNCSSGAANFTIPLGSVNKRHKPVFRLHSWTNTNTNVSIGGTPGVLGTDYVIDDLGGGIGLLQLLSERTADTAIVVS